MPSVFWLFGAFILLCGLTHFIDAMMFWWPAYRLNGLLRFLTACVSWLTVFALIKVLPQAFALKTSHEFNAELAERKRIEKKLNEHTIELEQKNKDIEQFAYIASHDLQEPIRTVANYVQVIKEDYGSNLDDRVDNYLNSIERATTRMSVLVKGLMDFSYLGINSKLTCFNCKTVLDDTLADIKTVCDASQATITIGTMPTLYGYEIEMRQLFQNLILNAIKFHKKGVAPVIHIDSTKIDGKWKFSVTDNGIGIDPVHYDRIFNIFQQLHNDGLYEGYGIGLANCKKIVELHKGEIWIDSKLGKGTTFYFTISNLHQ